MIITYAGRIMLFSFKQIIMVNQRSKGMINDSIQVVKKSCKHGFKLTLLLTSFCCHQILKQAYWLHILPHQYGQVECISTLEHQKPSQKMFMVKSSRLFKVPLCYMYFFFLDLFSTTPNFIETNYSCDMDQTFQFFIERSET